MTEPNLNPPSAADQPPLSSPPPTPTRNASDEELARDYPSYALPVEKRNQCLRQSRLSDRGELLRRLGLTERDVANTPRITPQIKAAFGTTKSAVRTLRADDSPDSLKFMEKWNSLSVWDQSKARIEDVIVAAGLTPRRFMELLAGASMEHSATVSKLIVSKAQPKVLKATIKAATNEQPIMDKDGNVIGATNGDVKAQELFHKITGALPTPKGANFTFNTQNNRIEAEPKQQTPLQAMDAFLLEIDDVRKPKQLEAKSEPIIPVEVPEGAPEIEYLGID